MLLNSSTLTTMHTVVVTTYSLPLYKLFRLVLQNRYNVVDVVQIKRIFKKSLTPEIIKIS